LAIINDISKFIEYLFKTNVMNKYIIYGLYCPFTDSLHYVGKSSSYMIRPTQHLTESHSEKINEWVSQLKFLGHKPIIRILEECTETNIDERELAWIKKSADEGCYLLNTVHNHTNKILLQREYELENVDVLTIGKMINEARISAKLTGIELSQMAGIHRQTLRSIENGDTKVSIGNLKGVLNILGYDIIIRKKQ